ncbi:MAG: TerB family tellurite resistance protein [Cyanobacteriota bacterium]|nr:TerB family tellurite resistance protein [Cyanobacteriota bacterium]
MADTAQEQGGFQSEEIRAGILAEINDLKATAQAFGWDAIKDGSWFNQFLAACLSGYHERVIKQGGEAYLRGKYPGLPTEAVAGKLCEMAVQTAAIAGSMSGAAASGAVLTAGAGIPVAVTAVMAEVLFTIRLQLRLVYDLHLLYGIPLDASDPEDLLGLFAVVYGVKLAEVGGIGTKTLGPEVMRAQLYRLIHGNTKAIQAAVKQVLGPRIARSVTQKGILKTAVPVVGVAISAGWNYTATRLLGSRVRQEVRIKAGLREGAARLHTGFSSDEQARLAMIEGLLALAIADGEFDDLEREVYLAFLRQLNLSEEQLTSLASRVHTDLDGVLAQLRSVEDAQSREAMGRCFCLIAASDGALRPAEKQILAQLLEAIGQSQQLEQAEELCARFRKEEGALGQAMGAVSDVVGSAASNASDAVGSALGWMTGKLRNQHKADEVLTDNEFKADAAELRAQQLLQKLGELDRQRASGEISAEDYQARWADLKAQIPSADQPSHPITSATL